jgi:hypothetical protein
MIIDDIKESEPAAEESSLATRKDPENGPLTGVNLSALYVARSYYQLRFKNASSNFH